MKNNLVKQRIPNLGKEPDGLTVGIWGRNTRPHKKAATNASMRLRQVDEKVCRVDRLRSEISANFLRRDDLLSSERVEKLVTANTNFHRPSEISGKRYTINDRTSSEATLSFIAVVNSVTN